VGKRTIGLLTLFIVGHGGNEQPETAIRKLEEKDKGEGTAAPPWTKSRRKEESRKYHSYTANEKGAIDDRWF